MFAMNRRSGFTFVELLVVIIIIGVLATLSVPKFRTAFDNFELENFVREIYSLSRYLQASAISQGKIHYLEINKEAQEFQASSMEGDELKQVPGRFGKAYKAPSGINISIDPPEKNGVYFYPDASTDKITFTFENRHKSKFSLNIKGASGGIKIQ